MPDRTSQAQAPGSAIGPGGTPLALLSPEARGEASRYANVREEQTVPTHNDSLFAALDELERLMALDATRRAPGWLGQVDQALTAVEQGMRERANALTVPEEGLVEIDRPPLPSPTVTRRAEELRQELVGWIEEARRLREKLAGTAPASGLNPDPSTLAGALPVAPEAGALPDFGVFYRRTKNLLEGLQHYQEEEAKLILDSVTPDIGAGD